MSTSQWMRQAIIHHHKFLVSSSPSTRGCQLSEICPPCTSLVIDVVIFGDDDDGDPVPELGVKGVDECLQVELIIRRLVHQVCPLRPLKLNCAVVLFVDFRIWICEFTEIIFVFALNMHLQIFW